MPRFAPFAVSALAAALCAAVPAAVVRAQTPPAAAPAAAAPATVPKGEVLHFTLDHSKIFPGTFRDYYVYVPAQYSPDTPACVYVNQDGVQWKAPEVFDRLIAAKEMPVTIAIFVSHGRVRAADSRNALDRFNRSVEYDGIGDAYARFVLNELLPDVESKKATDGRVLRLSTSANDRAIGGSSSGAIAAFTAAWERPDAFSRVWSAIGTYVGLRGGDRYPTLIRKTEPRPLRIFLQDGSHDLNIYGGDWFFANQLMERALTFSGYEVNHAYGEGGHSGQQGTEIFPDVMRFLWKDWPAPVKTGKSGNQMLNDLVAPDGHGWEEVTAAGLREPFGLISDPAGAVQFRDLSTGRQYRVAPEPNALPSILPTIVSDASGAQAWGPGGGKLWVYKPAKTEIAVRDAGNGDREKTVVRLVKFDPPAADPIDMVVGFNGTAYVAQAAPVGGGPGYVWRVSLPAEGKKEGTKQALDLAGLDAPTGVTLSPDQTLLYVADGHSHWVWSYQIQPDGSLAFGQRYYYLHTPDVPDDSGATAMTVDNDGRLYVATRLGVQVCDQAGRVNVILPLPQNRRVTGLTFGGANRDVLFVQTGDKIYRRAMKAVGSPAYVAPHRPAPPGL